MTNELFGVCPFVTAQKLLQGKWAILILHALNEGTKRFNELERDIQITHATLSFLERYSATFWALPQCCGMRRCRVSRPRFSKNAFCGDWMLPRSRISCAVALVM